MSLQQARKHPEHTGNPQLGQFCQDPVRITFTEEARTKGAFPERKGKRRQSTTARSAGEGREALRHGGSDSLVRFVPLLITADW